MDSMRVIQVKWIDAENHQGWETIKSLKSASVVPVVSVGFEVVSDKEQVILALARDDKNKCVANAQVIPRKSILEIKLLRKA